MDLVRKTPAGQVVHARTCRKCEGEGEVEERACGHQGAACPCSTALDECGDCKGEGVTLDLDCDCERCCAAEGVEVVHA